MKGYIKVSREEFALIGWTQLRGAVTKDCGFYVEKDSPAYEELMEVRRNVK